MVAILKRIAKEDEAGDEEGGAEPEDEQAGFGFEAAGVAALVAGGDGVVEPVAGEFPEDGGGDGGEVEEAWFEEFGLAESKGRWMWKENAPICLGPNL